LEKHGLGFTRVDGNEIFERPVLDEGNTHPVMMEDIADKLGSTASEEFVKFAVFYINNLIGILLFSYVKGEIFPKATIVDRSPTILPRLSGDHSLSCLLIMCNTEHNSCLRGIVFAGEVFTVSSE